MWLSVWSLVVFDVHFQTPLFLCLLCVLPSPHNAYQLIRMPHLCIRPMLYVPHVGGRADDATIRIWRRQGDYEELKEDTSGGSGAAGGGRGTGITCGSNIHGRGCCVRVEAADQQQRTEC